MVPGLCLLWLQGAFLGISDRESWDLGLTRPQL